MSSQHKPNPHTVEVLRSHDFAARTEEHRFEVRSRAWEHKYKNPRSDFLGIFDVVAMRQDQGILGIQCTDAQDTYKHRTKMLKSEFMVPWLQSGGRGQIWQWLLELKGTRPVYRPHILEAKLVDGVVNFVPVSVEDWLGTLYGKKKSKPADDEPEAQP